MRRRALILGGMIVVTTGLIATIAMAAGLPPEFDSVWTVASDTQDQADALVLDESGNIYIAGLIIGEADVDLGAGELILPERTGYVSKQDANGDLIWALPLVGADPFNDGTDIDDLAVDSAGNLYVTGSYRGTVDFDPGPDVAEQTVLGTSSDAFLAKYDSNGNHLWARSWGNGDQNTRSRGVALDEAGNVAVAGEFRMAVDFDPDPIDELVLTTPTPGPDIYVSKFDVSGDFLWAVSAGSPSSDRAWDLAVDGTGNIYSIGSFTGTVDFDPDPVGVSELTATGGAGDEDTFLWKLDPDGLLVWARSYGSQFDEDEQSAIAIDPDGHIYGVAEMRGNIDFDPGPGVVDAGTPGDSHQLFVWRVESSGDVTWARATGNDGVSGSAQPRAVAADETGVYITGRMFDAVDFDPGPGEHWVFGGDWDAFVWRLDANGGFGSVVSAGHAPGEDVRVEGFKIAPDGAGGVYVLGTFGGPVPGSPATVDFDPDPVDEFLVESAGHLDIFLWKLSNADVDGDGIANDVDPDDNDAGNDTFDDEEGTFGTIIDRADLDLAIVDSSSVRITAGGGGVGTALLSVCVDEAGLMLTDGDEVVLTCGSVSLEVVIGPIEVDLGDGVVLSAGTGAVVIIEEIDGVVTVTNHPDSTGEVTIDDNGVEIPVPPGTSYSSNTAPVCEAAVPSRTSIWPANGKLVAIGVAGLSDPDGDQVSIVIDSIFQDEPTGNGPDGSGVGTGEAMVRAERDGNGDGRVYHIGFTAEDGNGGSCSGEVLVAVPKSQGNNGMAVDGGALYDSTT